MSENLVESRPRRTNANTHPGKIILDSKQKRRTPAEKAAAEETKAMHELEQATNTQKSRQASIARIAKLEDAIQREDKVYPNTVSKKSRKSQKTRTHSDDNETEQSDASDSSTAPIAELEDAVQHKDTFQEYHQR